MEQAGESVVQEHLRAGTFAPRTQTPFDGCIVQDCSAVVQQARNRREPRPNQLQTLAAATG